MLTLEYGSPSASTILIQMVNAHEAALLEKEFTFISENVDEEFQLIAFQVENWNLDLSPWSAPAVYGEEDFGDGASRTLLEVLGYCTDQSKRYYIGGYSLAGLFALWAACQTSIFEGVAAASPSVWFPGFVEYMKEHEFQSDTVYLSLGSKEEKTRNPVMATVGERIRETYDWLKGQGKTCVLEWNPGGHFRETDQRMAKAFAWVMKQ